VVAKLLQQSGERVRPMDWETPELETVPGD
jgi:hypothetical protein